MTDIREIVVANIILTDKEVIVMNVTSGGLINTFFQRISTGTFSIQITGDIFTQTAYPYIILTPVGSPLQPINTNNSPIITENSYEFIIEIYDQRGNLVDGALSLVIYEGGLINE